MEREENKYKEKKRSINSNNKKMKTGFVNHATLLFQISKINSKKKNQRKSPTTTS